MNIAIYSVLGEKESIVFEKNISQAIKKQLFDFIKLKNIKEDKNEIRKSLIPFSQIYLQQNQGVFNFLSLLWEKGIKVAIEKIGYDLQKPVLRKQWIIERSNLLTQNIDEIISNWLFNTTQKSKSYGLSSFDIVRYLSEKIDEVAQKKGEIITRDIILTTINIAEYETYRFNHIKGVSWKVVLGEENEKECLENEMAGIIKLGNNFPSGHKFPPNGAYCSCFMIPASPNRGEPVNKVYE